MLFNSYAFCFVFLPAVLLAVFALRHQNWFSMVRVLIFGSLVFYLFNNPMDLWPLVASLGFNYAIARKLLTHRSKWLFALGVVGNAAFLGFYKYFALFSDNTGLLTNLSIVLPLAISFYTFQQIAFLTDIYNRVIKGFDTHSYLTFICFFPQLVAGPIVHYNDVTPQFKAEETRKFNIDNFSIGLCIFLTGLFKKVVLADIVFMPTSDKIFSAIDAGVEPTFVDSWIGILCYSFQIFFDFSGYSDMAIGLARMFNITLPINFNSPYKSASIIQFWRNWHITLSNFLKTYIYIPLGGSRKGQSRQYANLLIVMFIAGLWHGSGLHFVIWGILHGLLLCINHVWNLVPLGQIRENVFYKLASVGFTFGVVTILWSFFRASDISAAMVMLEGLAGLNGIVVPEAYGFLSLPFIQFNEDALLIQNVFQMTAYIVFGLFVVWFMPNVYQVFRGFKPALYVDKLQSLFYILPHVLVFRYNAVWLMFYVVLMVICTLSLGVVNREFLYFQF